MIMVRFNDEGEFEEELRQAGPPEDLVLRLTKQWTRTSVSPAIQRVTVIATYVRDGKIIKLERYCGDDWGHHDSTTKATHSKADGIMFDLTKTAQDLGLKVRAGIYEEALGK